MVFVFKKYLRAFLSQNNITTLMPAMTIKSSDRRILLIGSGLAGLTLAYFLTKKGATVSVVSSNKKPSSSAIAAGLFNPIVFKRYTQSWMADVILPFALSFYSEIEKLSGCQLVQQPSFYKIVANDLERNEIKKAQRREHYAKWCEEKISDFTLNGINANSFLKIKKAGWVDIPAYLKNITSILEEKIMFANQLLCYNELNITDTEVIYKNNSFSKVVFCEGAATLSNPFFNNLPFNLCKGEIIIIHSPGLKLKSILNKGIFIIPLGNDYYRVGATYIWNDLWESPTEQGIAELEEKLTGIINVPYVITEKIAGIRPTVKDRRPLLGSHPKYKNLFIFNGLGTKGVLLAPYWANELAENIIKNKPLDAEVDISRFANGIR